MRTELYYSVEEFEQDAHNIANQIIHKYPNVTGILGIPRGGIPLAAAVSQILGKHLLINERAGCVIVDDIVDSGATRDRHPHHPFFSIHMREGCPPPSPQPPPSDNYHYYERIAPKGEWVHYWWEGKSSHAEEAIVTRTLQYIGEDPHRDGLKGTPERVLRSWYHLFSGYDIDPRMHIKTFDMAEYDQMVLLKNIEMYSMCEHHMLPFLGKAHVAYIPKKGGHVIGISKLARIVDVYARRLQIQERIGEQVTSLLMEELDPVGAACVIEADHLCMRMRGVEKQNSTMITSSLKGVFLENTDEGRAARAELMGLIK